MSEVANTTRTEQVLRDAQRHADECARLAMREGARFLELSSQLKQQPQDISDFEIGYLAALLDVARVFGGNDHTQQVTARS